MTRSWGGRARQVGRNYLRNGLFQTIAHCPTNYILIGSKATGLVYPYEMFCSSSKKGSFNGPAGLSPINNGISNISQQNNADFRPSTTGFFYKVEKSYILLSCDIPSFHSEQTFQILMLKTFLSTLGVPLAS